MTTSSPAIEGRQLPDGFTRRLQLWIPRAADNKLYRLLRTDPYNAEVFDRLIHHHRRLQRSPEGVCGFCKQSPATMFWAFLVQEYVPDYADVVCLRRSSGRA